MGVTLAPVAIPATAVAAASVPHDGFGHRPARFRATTSRLVSHALATAGSERELGSVPVCLVGRPGASLGEMNAVAQHVLARPLAAVTLSDDAGAMAGRSAVVAVMSVGEVRRGIAASRVEHAMFLPAPRPSERSTVEAATT
jgi:hypothetical protein